MTNLGFKGFGVIDGTKESFDETTLENEYITRTNQEGESGYIYINKKTAMEVVVQ